MNFDKFIWILFLEYFVNSVLGDCKLNLNNNLPKKNDPVYLVYNGNKLELALPQPGTGSITLKPKQNLILACTGSRNKLSKASRKDVTESKCSSGTKLDIEGKSYESTDLNCEGRSTASLSFTGRSCGIKGEIIHQGFQVKQNLVTLVDTCYSTESGAAYWSEHTLYGTVLSDKVKQHDRPDFVTGDRKIRNPDNYYKQKQQEATFNKYYGTNKYININKQLYLARGHLAPDGDFIFSSWQMLTYFYINVAPQWQSINNGNWRVLEGNVRSYAMRVKKDIKDYTGTYGILSLPDNKNINKKAYLDPDKKLFPVPQLFWKILQNPMDNACIVLISTNDPYLKTRPNTICPDICSQTGWPSLQNDLTKGYVYCCSYSTFYAAVSVQAPRLTCLSNLKYN